MPRRPTIPSRRRINPRHLNTVPNHLQHRFAVGNAVHSKGFVSASVGDDTYDRWQRSGFFKALGQVPFEGRTIIRLSF